MALSPIVGILICTVSSIYAQQLWNFNQQEFQEPQFPAQFRNFQEPQQVASSSQAHVVRTPQQQQQFSQQQQQQFTQQQQQQQFSQQQQQQFPQQQQQQFTQQQQQQFPQEQQQFPQQQQQFSQQQFTQQQQQQFTQQQQQEFPQQFNNRPQDFAPVTHSPHTPESQQVVKKPPVVPNFRRDLPPPPPAQFMPDKATLHTIRRPVPRARQRRPFLVQHTITRRPFQPFVASNVTEIHTVSHVSTTTFTSHTTTAFPTLIPTQAIIRRPNFGRNTTLSKSGKDPNKYFLECCKKKKVEPKCESRCNFEVLSKKVLTGMFIGSDVCPNSYGIDLFSCAAQDSDHTKCCISKHVERTSAKEKCLAFCKMTPGSSFQADASYLPCWGVLGKIKECFKEAIINGN